MSSAYASATATPPSRRGLARLWADPETRSVLIGLGAVVLFHLLLFLLAPLLLRIEHLPSAPRPASTAREFNIELAPDTELLRPTPKAPDPTRFVETNPEAPENMPDKTNNFAAQNQQAAQEKPNPKGTSDRAATEGKKDFESNQIVSGRLTQPMEQPAPPPTPMVQPTPDKPMTPPRAEQNPLAGTEKVEGPDAAGIGSSVAKRLENMKSVTEKVEGVKDAKELQGAPEMPVQRTIDRSRPQPRPQLVSAPKARPAILAENPVGTKNMGISGIDARWSNYGAYLQKMVDAVQIQWERLILQMSAMPAGGSTVSVKFIINDQGQISAIRNVESSASETGSRACVSAITDRAPYGPWTDDMKAMLGSQQEMTFTFYYQ